MTRRDNQREQRRQKILFAGLTLFIRKGYTGTKIKDIANAVEMSVGLLFHYFASKEELYLELVSLGIQGPMNSIQPGEMEPLAFFEKTADQIIGYIRMEPFVAKMFVFMSQVYYSEDVPVSVKERLSGLDIFTPTAAIIERGQAAGTIRKGDPTALAIAFWSAIQGVAGAQALNPNVPCPQSEWIVDILRNHDISGNQTR